MVEKSRPSSAAKASELRQYLRVAATSKIILSLSTDPNFVVGGNIKMAAVLLPRTDSPVWFSTYDNGGFARMLYEEAVSNGVAAEFIPRQGATMMSWQAVLGNNQVSCSLKYCGHKFDEKAGFTFFASEVNQRFAYEALAGGLQMVGIETPGLQLPKRINGMMLVCDGTSRFKFATSKEN